MQFHVFRECIFGPLFNTDVGPKKKLFYLGAYKSMNKLIGISSVVFGAASYGILATVVKLGNIRGLESSGLVFYQYLFGFLILILLSRLGKERGEGIHISNKSKLKLLLFGTSLGLTSCFYYLSIQYVPVSIAIILLMQAIWMGGVVELILDRTRPDYFKIIGSIVVLLGTLLAVDIFNNFHSFNIKGLAYGILASISFTITLTATNRVENFLPIIARSKYLVLGGFLVVLLFWNVDIFKGVLLDRELLGFGLFLGIFGAVIPPLLFNKGFPIIGVGLGSVLASIEIPVSILSAKILLEEHIKMVQWMGVFIILISVVIINFRYFNTANKDES